MGLVTSGDRFDGVRVNYYGVPTPLNQVASVNVPDARLITNKPWEKTLIPEIEKAIRAANLGRTDPPPSPPS